MVAERDSLRSNNSELSFRMGELHKEITGLRAELGRASVEHDDLMAHNGSRVAELHEDIEAMRKGLMASRADLQNAVNTIAVI